MSTRNSTSYFDTVVNSFALQYNYKPCFQDRLNLFRQSICESVPPPARILDYGCGPGLMSLAFSSMGYNVLGLDGSAKMIESACKTKRECNAENLFFNIATDTDLVLDSDSFDGAVCSSVLEYVQEDIALLRKLITAVKCGGWLLFSVPHSGSMGGCAEDCLRRLRRLFFLPKGQIISIYLRRYNLRELEQQLASMGLGNFSYVHFEFPMFGKYGICLSRFKILGVMTLIKAQKMHSYVK